MNANTVLISVSLVIILAHLIGVFSRFARIPSVLILLLFGSGAAYLLSVNRVTLPELGSYVRIFGTIGLILIVLETSIDLKITRDKRSVILRAALSAFSIIVLSTAGIAGLFRLFFNSPLRVCIVHAIPLSIISSAITIPSIEKIEPSRREFLTYEATFSDIIGVLLFNIFASEEPITLAAGGLFLIETVGLGLASIVVVALLVGILQGTGKDAKFFLVLAALTLAYSLGKLFHLSSLILVLIFGLTLGNLASVLSGRLGKLFRSEPLLEELPLLRRFITELSFFTRTFFFIVLGMSIKIETLFSSESIILGTAVIAIILLVRLAFLKILRINAGVTETLVSPRGLVTVLLVFGIPSGMRIGEVYDDVVYLVILISAIIMTIGIVSSKANISTRVDNNMSD